MNLGYRLHRRDRSESHTCFLCLLDLEDFRRPLSSEEEEDGGLLPRSRLPISFAAGHAELKCELLRSRGRRVKLQYLLELFEIYTEPLCSAVIFVCAQLSLEPRGNGETEVRKACLREDLFCRFVKRSCYRGGDGS